MTQGKTKKTQERFKTLQTLNMLERKHKFNSHWDNDVKIAFHISGSLSFEDLVYNDQLVANNLMSKWK
jgi:hypothetical protein